VEPGGHPTIHTPDTQQHGDPSVAPGTNASEPGFEPPRRRERERKPATPEQAGRRQGVVYEGGRSRYDREYLQENPEHVAGIIVDALKNEVPDLNPAAEQFLQSAHVFAESVAKRKGASLSQAAQKHHIPLPDLSLWVRRKLIPTLYKARGTTYIANETAEEVSRDYREAKEVRKQPARLLEERRKKYFPEEASTGVIYERGTTGQGSAQAYEVVATLRQAAEITGVPSEEIVTISDIAAEWNLSKSRIREWRRSGPHGQPHLTPLSVRLKGQGTGQLLFWRKEVERVVADPPKQGPPRKHSPLPSPQ
jgi:hypothetical protein